MPPTARSVSDSMVTPQRSEQERHIRSLFFAQLFVERQQRPCGLLGKREQRLNQAVIHVLRRAPDRVNVEFHSFLGSEMPEQIGEQRIDIDRELVLRSSRETQDLCSGFFGGAAIDDGMKKAAVDADTSACRRFQ